MKYYIETERLILKAFELTDDIAFFEMDSKPEVHKYLGNKPSTSIVQAKEIIENIRQQYTDNGICCWAVIEKESGNFIGWSGLKFIKEYENNHINFYDVGYRLHPKYWGKGYAAESAKAAIKYGFTNMKLNKIFGIAHVDNKASRNALEKCGLKFIEKFDFHLWNVQCDWLKITKEEWQLKN